MVTQPPPPSPLPPQPHSPAYINSTPDYRPFSCLYYLCNKHSGILFLFVGFLCEEGENLANGDVHTLPGEAFFPFMLWVCFCIHIQ
jgi:hypothetical protein